MSFNEQAVFTKENIDTYLNEIAKEYQREIGKYIPAELILIGGASVLVNYGFRDMTTDIDAIIHAASGMKEIINHVGDRFKLPNGWLNQDFIKTGSYSTKLVQFSEYYRTFGNVLTVRTVSEEYLIAMKLRSGRQYKSDLSDVLGILAEHEKREKPISIERIQVAVQNLYGDWNALPEMSRVFISEAMKSQNLIEQYEHTVSEEKDLKVTTNWI